MRIRAARSAPRRRKLTVALLDRDDLPTFDQRWWAELSPSDRLDAVASASLDWYHLRGGQGVPRLRRVCRVVERP